MPSHHPIEPFVGKDTLPSALYHSLNYHFTGTLFNLTLIPERKFFIAEKEDLLSSSLFLPEAKKKEKKIRHLSQVNFMGLQKSFSGLTFLLKLRLKISRKHAAHLHCDIHKNVQHMGDRKRSSYCPKKKLNIIVETLIENINNRLCIVSAAPDRDDLAIYD